MEFLACIGFGFLFAIGFDGYKSFSSLIDKLIIKIKNRKNK